MPTTVTWLWFGNQPQVNTTPNTPATQAEASTTVGYTAVGPDQIRPVDVTGVTRTVNIGGQRTEVYSTTYNAAATSPMTYNSPSSGGTVTTQITGFASIRYELTFPDGTSRQETGVGIQMANGDVFFRPAANTVNSWSDIVALRAVTIISATPADANTYVATVSFNADIHNLPIVCFAAGTLIRTGDGERPVETLAEGDLIWTRDHELQPVRWLGSRRLDAADLDAAPHLRPIRIRAGALGAGMPAQDLVVSPQHRILVRSAIAARMFGAHEILVPAKQLLSIPGIEIDEAATEVTYVHVMLDQHEVLMSNGAETESLYPGPMTIAALGEAAAAEIHAIFPQLADDAWAVAGARPFIAGKQARKLAERHLAHERPLAG